MKSCYHIGILASVLLLSFCKINAQSFEATVSTDSVLIGNYIILEFKFKNLEGDFEAPKLEGFEILSGPNISSSIQIINGEQNATKSYYYHIKPKDLGLITIQPGYIVSEGKTIESQAIEISVYPNPDGIITQPKKESRFDFFDFSFPHLESPNERNKVPEVPSKKTTKRKLKKI